jgi:hypothetical protein
MNTDESSRDQPPANQEPGPKPTNRHWAIAITVMFCVAAAVFAWDRFVNRHVEKGADAALVALKTWNNMVAVSPQVILNQKVIFTQSTNIAELCVARRDIFVEIEHVTKLGPVEKSIKLDGTFRVRAGFDLEDGFSIAIDSTNRHIVATLPRPVILSVHKRSFSENKGRDSLWSRVSAQEYENALNQVEFAALRNARNSGLEEEARKYLEERVQKTADAMGMTVELRYPDRATNSMPDRIPVEKLR